MQYAYRDWGWFSKYFGNRFSRPMFSINKRDGESIYNNKSSVRVTGSITQEYRQQNSTTHPGVNSSNVIAYRNISNNPNAPIVVLNNRMDGNWGENPGDSGVGGAIFLGIAKYFHDNNITPKYNLMFLFTTGEEYGMRGAQHFVDSHPRGNGLNGTYNFIHWISFEQLGFNYPLNTSQSHCLYLTTNNNISNTDAILRSIGTQNNYEERVHRNYTFNATENVGDASEDYVWNQTGVNTILFAKDGNWAGHHQTGCNFTEGDSLTHIDRNDVNVTFELAWNVTKYFTVWPNCWFSNVTFTVFDSPNDGDTLNDSIRTNFTIHSVLPSDRVRVELDLGYQNGEDQGIQLNADTTNYTITSGI